MIDYRENNKWTVYIHISPSNKYYVGITSRELNQRWKNGIGYKKNDDFYRAIEEYGWDNFQHEIIAEYLTKDEACNMEKLLIAKLNSNDYHYGYNISSGGDCGKSGVPTSQLQKDTTSKRLKELWQDEEYRKKETEILRCLHNDKWRENQSKKIKERWETAETREKYINGLRLSYQKRKEEGLVREPLYGSNNPNAKKIVCLNTNEIFDSIVDAEAKYHTYKGGIGDVCNKRRKSVGVDKNGLKMVWVFYDEYVNLSKEEIKKMIYEVNSPTYIIDKFVLNIDDNKIFSSQAIAAKYYNIHSPCNIGNACRKGCKSGDSHWKFYIDYLKENNLTDKEARKSLIFIE